MTFLPQHIIIHHSLTKDSGTVSWQAIRRYHLGLGWTDIGYHFGLELVNSEWEVLMGRPMNREGAHTLGMNLISFGICVVGNYDDAELPETAYRKLVDLIEGLIVVVPTIAFLGYHRAYAVKSCPGRRFPYRRLDADFQRMLDASRHPIT